MSIGDRTVPILTGHVRSPLPGTVMGSGSSRPAAARGPPAAQSRGYAPSAQPPAVCVRCPSCNAVLAPPPGHFMFRCPCGTTLTHPGAGGPRARLPPSPGERMIMSVIEGFPPSHPQRRFLQSLLMALPRNPDGSINVRFPLYGFLPNLFIIDLAFQRYY